MKQSDLMIGDWVNIANNKKEIRNFYIADRHQAKIIALFNDKIGVKFLLPTDNPFEEICNEEDVSPIPLTPEILEKNGWEERPTGYVFYTDGKRYDNSLWYIFGSNTFVVNTANFQIKYVHELQHAFRLCNIDKEVEL